MQAENVIQKIREAVLEVKSRNQEFISVTAMETYLDLVESDIKTTGTSNTRNIEIDLAAFRAEHERNLAEYEASQTHSMEMLRSVIAYGQSTLKSGMLINGGAAAALLAFIGNVWIKGIAENSVGALTSAIAFFAFGVLAAGLGTAGAYFTQYLYADESFLAGRVTHILSVVLALAAFILFGLGAYQAYFAFTQHFALIQH